MRPFVAQSLKTFGAKKGYNPAITKTALRAEIAQQYSKMAEIGKNFVDLRLLSGG
jgi:hypothetical protein